MAELRQMYLELPNSVTVSVGATGEVGGKKKLCTIPVPLAGGFVANLEIYFVYGVEGNMTISYVWDGSIGVQYVNGQFMNISGYAGRCQADAEAAAKLALRPEIALAWTKAKFLSIGAEVGVKASAKATQRTDVPLICVDVKLWAYLDVFVEPQGVLNFLKDKLTFIWHVYDEDNSPYRKNPLCHVEDGKVVEKCTYGSVQLAGNVRDTGGAAVPGCSVTVSSGGSVAKRVWAAADGSFAMELPAGEYTVSFNSKGYKDNTQTVVLDISEKERELSVTLRPRSGEYHGIEWSIDGSRKLTLEGECTEWFSWSDDEVPWRNDRAYIQLAKVAVTGLTDMAYMFEGYERLKSVDFEGTDTESVTDMSDMFKNCVNLTGLDLSGFDTGNVTDMSSMFFWCISVMELDVGNFDTRNVTDMSGMFDTCQSLTSLDLSGFATRNVVYMWKMFSDCRSLTSLNISGFDTGNVTDTNGMFMRCSSLTILELSGFDTGNVTDMRRMFLGCRSLTGLDLSGFDTRNVMEMDGMFLWCSSLTSLNLSSFNTGNVKAMNRMFSGCSSLTSLNLSGFNTGNVTDMGCMFSDCSSLTSLNLSGFNTGNVTDMGCMFAGCSSLTNLNLSSFNTENVGNMDEMFISCENLKTIYFPPNWPADVVPPYSPWTDK